MPAFTYKAARKDGTVVHGSLSAPSQEAALRQMRNQDLTPVSLLVESNGHCPVNRPQRVLNGEPSDREVATPAALSRPENIAQPAASGTDSAYSPSWCHVPARSARAALHWYKPGDVAVRSDILVMTAELAVLLRAGLPIDRAFKVQIDMSSNDGYTALLRHLLDTIKSGKSLSHGLEKYYDLFGNFYISMVRSGEASGRLAEVLAQLADYLERSREVRSTVISALIYPVILVTVAVLSIMVMLGFVVPQFEALFADMGDALPGLTRVVIALGDGVKAYGLLMLILIMLFFHGIRHWLRQPAGRSWRDRNLLAIPLFGAVLFKYEVARFSLTMGTLLGNGVPMLQAINIALGTVDNTVVRQSLHVLPPAIKSGQRMFDALIKAGTFTPMVIQMVRVGEESGRLDEMLLELARVYDNDVQSGLKRALIFLEPVLILGMGMMIALIIVSILMGIMSVNDLAM